MDTTLSNPRHSATLIQQALNAGKRINIIYTYRPIVEALAGILERARTDGRTISIATLIRTHDGAARTILQLHNRYADHPNIEFRFIDNSAPEPKAGTVALARNQDYGESRDQLHAILESKRHEIPDFIYEAAKGSRAWGASGSAPTAGDQ